MFEESVTVEIPPRLRHSIPFMYSFQKFVTLIWQKPKKSLLLQRAKEVISV